LPKCQSVDCLSKSFDDKYQTKNKSFYTQNKSLKEYNKVEFVDIRSNLNLLRSYDKLDRNIINNVQTCKTAIKASDHISSVLNCNPLDYSLYQSTLSKEEKNIHKPKEFIDNVKGKLKWMEHEEDIVVKNQYLAKKVASSIN